MEKNKQKLQMTETETNTLSTEVRKRWDKVMKAVETDLKLAAWIAWSRGLLFQEKSLEEMREFIKRTPNDELKPFFQKQGRVAFRDEDNKGVIFDVLYAVKNRGETKAFLNLENQINPYSFQYISMRARVYVASLAFWQKRRNSGRGETQEQIYLKIKEVAGIWIFPKCSKQLQNTMVFDKIPFSSNPYALDAKNGERKNETHLDLDFENELSFYYLGSPSGIDFKAAQNKQDLKQFHLLKILDALFFPDENISLETREEILEYYGFDPTLLKIVYHETKEVMNILETYAQAYSKPLQQTIDAQKKEISKIISEKDQVINARDQVINEKDQVINEKDQEILKLKEKLTALEAEKAQN